MRAQVAVLIMLGAACVQTHGDEHRPRIGQERFQDWFDELSNWGRWGADDRLGTLNLITPEVRRAAAREVREGITVSLARDVEKRKAPDNARPFLHEMIGVGIPENDDGLMRGVGMDRYEVSYHGFAHTHLDALAHSFHGGRLYNGASQHTVTPQGAETLSVLEMKDGIVTRGLLIDLPRLLDVPYLDTDYVVTVDDLERWEKATKTEVRPGDAVILRTGRWARRAEIGSWDPMQGAAGVHPEVAFWLREHDVAVVGSDLALDALPSLVDGSFFPVHELAIVAMGMPILDALDLEALARTAFELDRHSFLLTVAPLAVEGGTGSPVNPVAVF